MITATWKRGDRYETGRGTTALAVVSQLATELTRDKPMSWTEWLRGHGFEAGPLEHRCASLLLTFAQKGLIELWITTEMPRDYDRRPHTEPNDAKL